MFIDIIVEKRMLVTKLFFVGLNVLPVRLVTKRVKTSKKNVAIVWIEQLMFVMGVIRKSITVRFPINTTTTLKLLIVYIDDGLFMARNVDLVRKVKLKPRKCHKTQIKDRSVFQGRTYLDFQELGLTSFTEMDTVHSAGECKRTLLTFFLTESKLFLACIMNRNTKGAVRLVFDHLEKRMGTYDFLKVFEYTLTDRGSEFGDSVSLEIGIHGMERSSIYYCDSMRSGQKGGVEHAHTLLRRVLPKGTSFEFLTQWDVNLIVNHINSTPRESLGGKTPYEVGLNAFGEDIMMVAVEFSGYSLWSVYKFSIPTGNFKVLP